MYYKRLSSMWEKPQQLRLANNAVQAYYKKSMDDICFQAELAESHWDYAYSICSGMKRLFNIGVDINSIINHNNLMQKLIYLGRDIMQTSNKHLDIFYLGVFVEIKIYSMWQTAEFYSFLVSALKMIKKQARFISTQMKNKLIIKLRNFNPEVYRQYVIESQ